MSLPHSKSSSSRHRTTSSFSRLEVCVNVYELLPQGRLSSVLWTLGSSLLHTGLVIKDKEYAYGGHDQRGVSGVYWTRPRQDPPGGTFKCQLLLGITLRTNEEIDTIISEAAYKFHGPNYNLLTNNCNHFTSYLCQQLTGTPAPSWLNRAASIGIWLPCLVPREWLEPPDADTADGRLVDVDDERAAMLGNYSPSIGNDSEPASDEEDEALGTHHNSWHRMLDRRGSSRSSVVMDTSGRALPVSERAPRPNG